MNTPPQIPLMLILAGRVDWSAFLTPSPSQGGKINIILQRFIPGGMKKNSIGQNCCCFCRTWTSYVICRCSCLCTPDPTHRPALSSSHLQTRHQLVSRRWFQSQRCHFWEELAWSLLELWFRGQVKVGSKRKIREKRRWLSRTWMHKSLRHHGSFPTYTRFQAALEYPTVWKYQCSSISTRLVFGITPL